MAGIPVHTSSPINPNTPTKSKETTAEPTSTQDVPAYAPATTTASVINSAQTAQPGASAVPAPSAAATAYAPPPPTRTLTVSTSAGPPPPQPGQVPKPFTEASTIPPPPRAISNPSDQQPAQSQDAHVTQPPSMTNIQLAPSFAYAQPPAGVTSTATDLSHPPGYEQQRGSFDDRYVEQNETSNPFNLGGGGGGGGILDGGLGGSSDESPIWNTAVGWAKEAGRKLSVVEGEVWKKINGDK